MTVTMRIVITGSIAFDYLMTYPGEFREMLSSDSEKISVSFLVDEMSRHPGGVAPNIAYTLALLGEHPILVGSAGQDFGEYRMFLEEAGVDTSGTKVHNDLFTASFFVSTDKGNNQIASFYTGAMARARDLTLANSVSDPIDLVVISPNDPQAMANHAQECRERHIPFIYDPSQQVARLEGSELARGLEGAFMLVVNDVEQETLCRKTGLSLSDLLNHAEIVVVTRGSDGADLYTPDGTHHIPVVPPDHIADPTGVGDAFRGGLLRGMADQWPWEICGRLGSLAATFALEHRGTQSHRYTRHEFVERFRKHFDDEGLLDQLITE